jgi:transposase-like protein
MAIGMRETCPECGSPLFKKNGHTHNGKQNHQCKTCGRQFVVNATNRVIDAEHRPLVERLRCEKISLHGICRALGILGCLEMGADELWSCVQQKADPPWL